MGSRLQRDRRLIRDTSVRLLKRIKGIPPEKGLGKFKRILLLAGQGTALSILMGISYDRHHPHASFYKDVFNENDEKDFQRRYLRRAVKRLEKREFIRVSRRGKTEEVVLTDRGRKEVLMVALESMVIKRPSTWDHKWRIVIYDIYSNKKVTRDKFQRILRNSGFYELQKSVYLHAFPCSSEVDLLRRYLGIDGEVRFIVADTIENDKEFRSYFRV
jgi:DNA-binding transcriptional regulator PaaX